MDHSARALVRLHPVIDLQDGEFKGADIYHVPGMFADLDAIAGLERLSPDDEEPAGEVGKDVTQGDGQTGTYQTEEGGYGTHALEPDPANQDDPQKHCCIGNGLPGVEPGFGILDML